MSENEENVKLNRDLVILALKKSISNAGRLIEDADLLKENSRYARAYCLYQLASEEVGKACICMAFLIKNKYNDTRLTKVFLKNFRHHIQKSQAMAAFILPFIFIRHADKPDKIQEALNDMKKLDFIKNDQSKNFSLYTSFKDGGVKNPEEVITKEMVVELQRLSKENYIIIKVLFEKNLNELDELIVMGAKNISLKDNLRQFFEITQDSEMINSVDRF